MKNEKVKYFIIAGCGRSGTTLLKSIINTHSDIFIPSETFYYDTISKLISKSSEVFYEDAAGYISKKWWIKDIGLSKDKILSCIASEDKLKSFNKDSLFLALLRASNSKNKALVGEKTPQHIKQAERLLEERELKVIQIIRDPRAVYNSYKHANVGNPFIHAVISEWKETYNIHKKLKDKKGYMYLTYENLVASPKVELKRICNFLGVDYTDELLNFYKREKTGFSQVQKHHMKTMSPLTSERINSWNDTLKLAEVDLIESCLCNGMKSLGYLSEDYSEQKINNSLIFCSKVADFFHKGLVRRPKQAIKMLKSLRNDHF